MQNKLAKCLNLSNEKDLCFNCNRMGKIIGVVQYGKQKGNICVKCFKANAITLNGNQEEETSQPRININVRVLVTLKIIEIVTKENISPLKAWYQLSKHEAFDDLMLFHRKTPQQIKHFKSSQDELKAFYYKHVERWLKDFKSRSYLKKYPTIKTYLKK